jgi:ssDNA-binding Zn-finger/Zn-ribbon topoisomerase 1
MPLPYPPEPSLIPIERPRCSKCHGRMMLARTESGRAGADLRTFECPKCEYSQKMAAEDPMKSQRRDGRTANLDLRNKRAPWLAGGRTK